MQKIKSVEEITATVKAKVENMEELIKSRIKEIEDKLQDDYEEHLKSQFQDGASIGADFEIWTNRNCNDFDTWYNEEADSDLCEELEYLESILVEDD